MTQHSTPSGSEEEEISLRITTIQGDAFTSSTTTTRDIDLTTEFPFENTTVFTYGYPYEPGEVYIFNKPLQCFLISAIILLAVAANSLVINNISQSQIKARSVNFCLIKNLCIVDIVGALLILPVPLVATAKGRWDFGPEACRANGTVNIALWFQHIVLFALLKIDRALASCLPIGKYPVLKVEFVTGLVVFCWFGCISVAAIITLFYRCEYEPAVVLCIPDLPIGFFIALFSVFCIGLVGMVLGYILVIVYLKKKQAKINAQNGMRVVNYSGLEKAALTSFLITIGHFLLYIPTMLVIGLRGWILHPIVILLCDMIVYSEFLIHPTVLLATSTKMRKEIRQTLERIAWPCSDCLGSCCCCAPLSCCQRKKKSHSTPHTTQGSPFQTVTQPDRSHHLAYAVPASAPPKTPALDSGMIEDDDDDDGDIGGRIDLVLTPPTSTFPSSPLPDFQVTPVEVEFHRRDSSSAKTTLSAPGREGRSQSRETRRETVEVVEEDGLQILKVIPVEAVTNGKDPDEDNHEEEEEEDFVEDGGWILAKLDPVNKSPAAKSTSSAPPPTTTTETSNKRQLTVGSKRLFLLRSAGNNRTGPAEERQELTELSNNAKGESVVVVANGDAISLVSSLSSQQNDEIDDDPLEGGGGINEEIFVVNTNSSGKKSRAGHNADQGPNHVHL